MGALASVYAAWTPAGPGRDGDGCDDVLTLHCSAALVSAVAVLPLSQHLQGAIAALDAAEKAEKKAEKKAALGEDEGDAGDDEGVKDDSAEESKEEEAEDDDAPYRFEHALVTAAHDGSVKVWDASKLRCLMTLDGHAGGVTCAAALPRTLPGECARLATGSVDESIKVWDLSATPAAGPPTALVGHTGVVSCVAAIPGTPLLASGSWDGTVKLWDVDDAALRFTVADAGGGAKISSLVVLHGESGATLIAAGSHDGGVRLIDLAARAVVGTMLGHECCVVAQRADGRRAAGGRSQGESWVTCLASVGDLLRDGTEILASGGLDKTIRIWDIASRSGLTVLRGHAASVSFVVAFDNGAARLLASGSLDKSVRVWDVVAGTTLFALGGHRGDVTCGCILPNVPSPFRAGGLFLCTGSADTTVKGWDLAALTRPYDPDAAPFVPIPVAPTPMESAPPPEGEAAEGEEEVSAAEGDDEGAEEKSELAGDVEPAAWVGDFQFGRQ